MELAVIILIALSLVFLTGGTVGIIRLPDFYTRLHAAGKMDTLGSTLMLGALVIANLNHFTINEILTSLKILLILAFTYLSNPTATHAIVDAGVRAGLKPYTKRKPGQEGTGEQV